MRTKAVLRSLLGLLAVVALAVATFVPVAAATEGVELGFDVRFTGVIRTVGGPGEAWVIGGQTLATDASTMIILTAGPAAPGMWADVAAKRQPDKSLLAKQITVRPEEVRLRGIVSARPPEGTVGDWIIAGVTVKVTADTKISSRGGSVDVGAWVEAVMDEEGGVLTARRLTGIAPQDAVEVSGVIQAFSAESWTISAIPVAINADTLISGTPVVDLIGRAAAELREDGTLLAKVLRVSWIDNNSLFPLVDFTGTVEKLPATGLKGEWTVDGKSVMVMFNTRINQEKGLVTVGAVVNVVGWEAFGKIIASQITVLESLKEGGVPTIFSGLIEALPEGGVTGIWTVGGQKIEVGPGTELHGAAPAVGLFAAGQGLRRASDGVIMASWLTVRSVVVPPSVTPPPRPTRPPRP